MRIPQRQRRLSETRFDRTERHGVLLQPLPPEIEAAGRNGERNFAGESVAFAARRHLRPREKSEVGAGMAFRVRVEKMVSAGIILVHTFLHQPHPEHARVEIEILLRRSGDRRDVMKSANVPHDLSTMPRRRGARYCQ